MIEKFIVQNIPLLIIPLVGLYYLAYFLVAIGLVTFRNHPVLISSKMRYPGVLPPILLICSILYTLWSHHMLKDNRLYTGTALIITIGILLITVLWLIGEIILVRRMSYVVLGLTAFRQSVIEVLNRLNIPFKSDDKFFYIPEEGVRLKIGKSSMSITDKRHYPWFKQFAGALSDYYQTIPANRSGTISSLIVMLLVYAVVGFAAYNVLLINWHDMLSTGLSHSAP